MIKKPYPPGVHGKRRRVLTEYGMQLAEKQKIRWIYGIRERQFKKYFKEASKEKGVTGDILLQKLEMRLDNVVFRLGFAGSRIIARQLVNHRHFLVNGKVVNFPSFQVKPKDVISIKKSSLKLVSFKDLKTRLKKYEPSSWLFLDKKKLEGKVASLPTRKDAGIPADMQMVVEFYSR